MFIYATISFAVSGVGNLAACTGDGETALAEIFAQKGMGWMSFVIFICAIMGITAAAMTNMMS
jgi:hypothetical protein